MTIIGMLVSLTEKGLLFLAESPASTNEAMRHFAPVFGIVMIVYGIIYTLTAEKLARMLTKMDQHKENNIKIRPFFVIERLIVLSVFLYGIALCIYYSDLALLFVFLIVLFGYSCLFIVEPCSVRLCYTEDELYYQVWGTKITIPRSRITRLAWERLPRTTGYSLIIYLDAGQKIVLHSEYFVGLMRARELLGPNMREIS